MTLDFSDQPTYAQSRAEARAELETYLETYPEERSALARLLAQFADGSDMFARSNMTGHITTSALVLDPSATKILLIHHKHHQMWLQPGGHFDGGESLITSAAREVTEETGVSNLKVRTGFLAPLAPLDIESHPITARPEKNEGAHWHHDYIYLFQAIDAGALSPQLEEVHGARWVDIADLGALENPRLLKMAEKLRKLGIVRV